MRTLGRIVPTPRGQVMLVNNSTNSLLVAEAWGGDLPDHAILHEARAILDRLLSRGALGPADTARMRRWETRLTAAIGFLAGVGRLALR